MNATEAKEILKNANGLTPKPYSYQEGVAKGFLLGLKADEVKAFVEALQPFADNFRVCSVGELDTLIQKARAALVKYLEAIKVP